MEQTIWHIDLCEASLLYMTREEDLTSPVFSRSLSAFFNLNSESTDNESYSPDATEVCNERQEPRYKIQNRRSHEVSSVLFSQQEQVRNV